MPEIIVFRTVKRYYDKDAKDYYDKNREYCAVLNNEYITKNLNEEVELIEAPEEIDIQEIEEIDLFDNGQNFNDTKFTIGCYDGNFIKIADIINELIKAVKQLDRRNK